MDQHQLLDNLVRIRSWNPACLADLCALAREPESYAETIAALEHWLALPPDDQRLPEAEQQLPAGACLRLYRAVIASAPLQRLLCAPTTRLSQVDPAELLVLAKLADIAPDPDPRAIFATGDGVFLRILEPFKSRALSTEDELLQRGIAKLLAIEQLDPELLPLLRALAQDEMWHVALGQVERRLLRASTPSEVERNPRDSAALKALIDLLGLLDQQRFVEFQQAFFTPPKLSWLLPEEVLLFVDRHTTLKAPRELLADSLKDEVAATQANQLAAKVFVDQLPPERLESIRKSFRLRIAALMRFWRLRQLAKLDALEQRWPELAQELRADAAELGALEGQLIDPDTEQEALSTIGRLHNHPDDLVALLRARPYFREIDADVLNAYFKAAQAVARPAPAHVAANGHAPSAAAAPQPGFANLELQLTPADPAQAGADQETYKLVLALDNQQHSAEVTINWPELLEKLPSGDQLVYGYSTRSAGPASGTRALASAERDLNATLRRSGQTLYASFFEGRGEVEQVLETALSSGKLRINLDTRDDNQRVMRLPWEAFYVPRIRNFPALMPQYSIVRKLPPFGKIDQAPVTPPLRILALLASPTDAPPLMVDKERAALTAVLEQALASRTVVLEFCPPNLDALRDRLRAFRPHLFHFVGHGVFSRSEHKGALLFEDDQKMGRLVDADTLRSTLTEYGIQLAVFNACDTGTSSTNDVITGVAGALVSNGIAACIGTTRAILEDAAILFASEFYRTLVLGYPLERALTEARRALRQEGHDWAAYALFTAAPDLNSFALAFPRSQDGQTHTTFG